LTSAARPIRRALVFSGGGARGAYEAGVVRYLLEELPRRLGRPVKLDILCGTSVGAIHASFLAATAHETEGRGQRLVDFWTSMRVDEILPVSARDLIRLPRRMLGMRKLAEAMRDGEAPERLYGLFDTRALEKLVVDSIPWRKIRSNVREGRVDAVALAATQIATGRVVIFMETRDRHIPRWTRDPTILPRPTRLLPTHALASAAIPLLFPAVRVASTYYADGGLRLNTPLAPAVRLGADRVLVVALRQDPTQAHEYGPDFVERLGEVSRRERGQAFRKIDDLVIRPSADLGQLAGQILLNLNEAHSRSPLVRLAARNLSDGQRSPESDLLPGGSP
jgi:NTE family protein